MATLEDLPSFYFRVDPMRPRPDQITRPPRGFTQPPRRRGTNLLDTSVTYIQENHVWVFSGRRREANGVERQPGVLSETRELPGHFQIDRPPRCHSVYVMDNDLLHTVPYDATANAVDDGRTPGDPDSAADFEDGGFLPDWELLQFKDIHVNQVLHSYALHNAGHNRLRALPANRAWLDQLLPTSSKTGVQLNTLGGLCGDITLLIALLVLSMPANMVSRVLPSMIHDTWTCIRREHCPAENYRTQNRGVVVKLWPAIRCQPERTGDRAHDDALRAQYIQEVQAWKLRFERYQNGELGLMFQA